MFFLTSVFTSIAVMGLRYALHEPGTPATPPPSQFKTLDDLPEGFTIINSAADLDAVLDQKGIVRFDDDGLPILPADSQHIDFEKHIVPLMDWYCYDCHSGKKAKGDANLEGFTSPDAIVKDFKLWERVVEQIEGRTMPPVDEDQPDEITRQRLAGYLRDVLDHYDADGVKDPGPALIRRLTHAEYNNTIRDLTGIDLKPAATFPADGGGGEGFTNNAATLFVSPLLMEKYLDAAQSVINHAEVSFTKGLTFHHDAIGPRDRQAWRDDALEQQMQFHYELIEPTGVFVDDDKLLEQYVPALFKWRHGRLSDESITLDQFAEDHGLSRYLLRRIQLFAVGDGKDLNDPTRQMLSHLKAIPAVTAEKPLEEQLSAVDEAVKKMKEVLRRNQKETARWFGDAQEKKSWILQNSPGRIRRMIFGINDEELREQVSDEQWQELERRERETRLRRDANEQQQREAASKMLADFAGRAYRRPLNEQDISELLAFFDEVRQRESSFEVAVQQTLRRVLVSPRFLFRIEAEPQGVEALRVTDTELASRLSYFIWSSMPDEQLMKVAAEGRLNEPVELEKQVRRMLADEKAAALADQFIAQWLGFAELSRHSGLDPETYPTYDDALRDAMIEEAMLFAQAVVRDDLPVSSLIDADFTFVNRRLAEVYDLDWPVRNGDDPAAGNADGDNDDVFRRVSTQDQPRGGVLGMGGVHLMTSYPTRPSPVLRGQWVLDKLLGSRSPPPPPNVGELEEDEHGEAAKTLRERLMKHRADPSCAVCHDRLDPVGFALQRYDSTGRWIEKDASGLPIDDVAEMPDGTRLVGADGLKKYLLDNKPRFHRQLAVKSLGYALGRELEYFDRPTLRRIEASLKEDERFSTMILEVVRSHPFQYRRAAKEEQ